MAEALQVSAFYPSLPAQEAIRVATEISTWKQVLSAAALTPPGQANGTAPAAPGQATKAAAPARPPDGAPLHHHGPAPSGRELAKGSGYFEPPRRGA